MRVSDTLKIIFVGFAIFLAAGDTFNILPPSLAFFENLMAYLMLAYLWYEINLPEVFFGSRARKLNAILVCIFYILAAKHLIYGIESTELGVKYIFSPLAAYCESNNTFVMLLCKSDRQLITQKSSINDTYFRDTVIKEYEKNRLIIRSINTTAEGELYIVYETPIEIGDDFYYIDDSCLRGNKTEINCYSHIYGFTKLGMEQPLSYISVSELDLNNCKIIPQGEFNVRSGDNETKSILDLLRSSEVINSFESFIINTGMAEKTASKWYIYSDNAEMKLRDKSYHLRNITFELSEYIISDCNITQEFIRHTVSAAIYTKKGEKKLRLLLEKEFKKCISNAIKEKKFDFIEQCGFPVISIYFDGLVYINNTRASSSKYGNIILNTYQLQKSEIEPEGIYIVDYTERIYNIISTSKNTKVRYIFSNHHRKSDYIVKKLKIDYSKVIVVNLNMLSLKIGMILLMLFCIYVGIKIEFEGSTIIYSLYIFIYSIINKVIPFDISELWSEISITFKKKAFIRKTIIIFFRAIFIYYVLIVFFLFVFDTITQWMVMSIDKALFLLGLIYAITSLRSASTSRVVETLSGLEENFVVFLTSFFLKPKYLYLGLSTLLITYTLSDLGFFVIPTIFGGVQQIGADPYFAQHHKPILTLIYEDTAGASAFYEKILIIIIYILDILAIFLFLSLPAIVILLMTLSEVNMAQNWDKMLLTKLIIALFIASSVPYYIIPWSKIVVLTASDVKGVDFQTHNIISQKDKFIPVILSSGILFVFTFVLQFFRKYKLYISLFCYVAIFIFFSHYIYLFAHSYISYMWKSALNTKDIFSIKIFGDFFVSSVTFYGVAYLILIYRASRWFFATITQDISVELSKKVYKYSLVLFLVFIPILEKYLSDRTQLNLFMVIILLIYISFASELREKKEGDVSSFGSRYMAICGVAIILIVLIRIIRFIF